ncbi:hypothetical protein N2152v2_004594 [Parachlorella kessleri]
MPASINSTGWPAACTLYNECNAGRVLPAAQQCQPLTLLLTACGESPELPQCSKYLSLCSPTSASQQCNQSQPLDLLPTASTAYRDVLALCGTQAVGPAECLRCSSGASGGPGRVGVQSVTLTCPDPFGSLSQLCLLNSSADATDDACQGWTAFCDSVDGIAFLGLCQQNYTAAPAPAPQPAPAEVAPAAAPAAAVGDSSNGSQEGSSGSGGGSSSDSSMTGGGQPDCYVDPGSPACADFHQEDATSREQLGVLCDAMPAMVGCTLWASCKNGAAAGRYCAPFSLLGDICAADMPDMRGCEGWVSLCGNQSSLVGQCSSEGPIKHVLLSGEATKAVLGMCGTHAMPQCAQCPSRFKCPDPLSTLSAMCLDMPTMADCTGFFEMCDEAGATFTGLCGGSGSSSSGTLPPMRMYLHQGIRDIILFKSWVPEITAAYVGSCVAVLFTALAVQALKAWRLHIEAGWVRQRAAGNGCAPACDGAAPPAGPDQHLEEPKAPDAARSSRWSDASALDVPLLKERARFIDRGQAGRNALRAGFTMVIVFLDYMLMLIVMTFNVGIIMAAVLGFGLGALLFGHVGEPGWRQAPAVGLTQVPGSLMGAPDPDPENSLEVQYVQQQSCCGGH